MKRISPLSVTLSVVSLVALLGACSGTEPSTNNVNNNTTNNTNNNTAGPTCDPGCDADACQVCQVNGDTAVCASVCGAGLTCEAGQCLAPEVASCEPGCDAGACMVCDTTGAEPVCRTTCADGLMCTDGVCQPPEIVTACEPACGPCQLCDATGEVAACVDLCDADEACNEATNACVRAGFHANFEDMDGPFADGPSVTEVCVGCHLEAAEHVINSPHYRWLGPTPNLQGHETGMEIGKKNLINNFCVSVPGNEARCSQCHAGYGYNGPDFDFDDITKIDCVVCHADPAAGYKKAPKTAGNVDEGVDLKLVAQSVGPSTRANCGSCHFTAGGGDNVKKGDMGSALKNPTHAVDVHMGNGMACANCHVDDDHTILGQGIHTPVSVGRLSCEDCHGAEPHELSVYNEHSLDIACQTCHVPAFSRQQPTKMWWDWSTAGNKTLGTDGIATTTLEDGTVVQSYNYMKGDFIWEKNVKPTYAWYDGRVSHMTLSSTFPSGAGSTADNPVNIARPLADKMDGTAKIFPFKVMKGLQPAHLTRNFLIAPDLFGPGAFWPRIPAAEDYTPEAVRTVWTETLTNGARAGGQLTEMETILDNEWGFVNTEMYMGINHEVAPKEMALGQPPCEGCHFNQEFPWADLGYDCDPIQSPEACGSRHIP